MGGRNKKKAAAALALILAGGACWAGLHCMNRQEPVNVYGFADGAAGQMGREESDEWEGVVTGKGIQPVYLSDSQTVLEIRVREGQTVKKGQVLFTCDTTLSTLALEQKRLGIERSKMDLEVLQQELSQIRNFVPMPTEPAQPPQKGPDPYEALRRAKLEKDDHFIYGGTGESPETARYCWLHASRLVDEALLQKLCTRTPFTYVVFHLTEDDQAKGEIIREYGVKLTAETIPEQTEPEQPRKPAEPAAETQPSPEQTEPESTEKQETPAAVRILWGFYDLPAAEPEVPEQPENSGYTAQEIRQLCQEKEEQIRRQEASIHMAQAEYRVMELEAEAGEVQAQTDGVIRNLLTPEQARKEHLPLMKIADGGGFYVRGTVGELDLDDVKPGQKMEIQAPETGDIYVGTVSERLTVPETGRQTEEEEAGISYYPYLVYVDQQTSLQEDMFVTMRPLKDEEGETLYVSNAFLHKENGKTYAFVRGQDGLLHRRELTLGPGQTEESRQVLAGITADDYLALPFEKHVREGAATREGSWETLFGGEEIF